MSGAAAIPEAWKEWLLQNRDRGCDPEVLMQRALDQGFPREAIAAVLQSSSHLPIATGAPTPDWLAWFESPLTRPKHRPRAWRLDTSLAQVYELPALLSHEECEAVIESINASLQPSTVTRGTSDYRTSRTAICVRTIRSLLPVSISGLRRCLVLIRACPSPFRGSAMTQASTSKNTQIGFLLARRNTQPTPTVVGNAPGR